MRTEPADKRRGGPRRVVPETHPWKKAAAEKAAKAPVLNRGWSCPSCGRVDCDFAECTKGDF
jgi:hypothetical protein